MLLKDLNKALQTIKTNNPDLNTDNVEIFFKLDAGRVRIYPVNSVFKGYWHDGVTYGFIENEHRLGLHIDINGNYTKFIKYFRHGRCRKKSTMGFFLKNKLYGQISHLKSKA